MVSIELACAYVYCVLEQSLASLNLSAPNSRFRAGCAQQTYGCCWNVRDKNKGDDL
jgi:hypothetical protein